MFHYSLEGLISRSSRRIKLLMEHLRGLRIENVAIFGGGGLSLLEEGVRNTLVWFRREPATRRDINAVLLKCTVNLPKLL